MGSLADDKTRGYRWRTGDGWKFDHIHIEGARIPFNQLELYTINEGGGDELHRPVEVVEANAMAKSEGG